MRPLSLALLRRLIPSPLAPSFALWLAIGSKPSPDPRRPLTQKLYSLLANSLASLPGMVPPRIHLLTFPHSTPLEPLLASLKTNVDSWRSLALSEGSTFNFLAETRVELTAPWPPVAPLCSSTLLGPGLLLEVQGVEDGESVKDDEVVLVMEASEAYTALLESVEDTFDETDGVEFGAAGTKLAPRVAVGKFASEGERRKFVEGVKRLLEEGKGAEENSYPDLKFETLFVVEGGDKQGWKRVGAVKLIWSDGGGGTRLMSNSFAFARFPRGRLVSTAYARPSRRSTLRAPPEGFRWIGEGRARKGPAWGMGISSLRLYHRKSARRAGRGA